MGKQPRGSASSSQPAAPRGPGQPRAAGGGGGGDVDVSSDIGDLGRDELQQKLLELRGYVSSGLRQDVEKQVFTDLSSHPTVAYIKSLEAEKKSAQAKLREEVERHRALRIAHRAQARMLEKQAGRGRGAPSQQEIAFA